MGSCLSVRRMVSQSLSGEYLGEYTGDSGCGVGCRQAKGVEARLSGVKVSLLLAATWSNVLFGRGVLLSPRFQSASLPLSTFVGAISMGNTL
jgi:hypothetical protein